MTNAFDTCVSINQVNAIALGDRLGRALWKARSTGDAFLSDFHCHIFSPSKHQNEICRKLYQNTRLIY